MDADLLTALTRAGLITPSGKETILVNLFHKFLSQSFQIPLNHINAKTSFPSQALTMTTLNMFIFYECVQVIKFSVQR